MAVILGQAEKIRDPARSTWDMDIVFFCFPSPAWPRMPRPAAPVFHGRSLILRCRAGCTFSSTCAVIISRLRICMERLSDLFLLAGLLVPVASSLLITPFVVLLPANEMVRLQAGYDPDGEIISKVTFDAVEVREIPLQCKGNGNAGRSGPPGPSDAVDVILRQSVEDRN